MKKVVVRGPILSRSGYGEHARTVMRALRSKPERFEIYAVNVGWGLTGWEWEDTEERRWLDGIFQKTALYLQEKGSFDLSIQVTIPSEWEKLAPENIGVTAGIETDKISPQWVEKTKIMDKIIVCSEHAKYAFDNSSYPARNSHTGELIQDFKCTTPIEVINYPFEPIEPEQLDLELTHDFNFLVVAQMSPRKNIGNTIAWFIEEFYDQEVGLILKVSVKNNSYVDRYHSKEVIKNLLDKYPDRKCSIHLLHGDLTKEQMAGLYTHEKVKCLVNIAHGEGYGLPMFEAAGYGLPVAAPDWGGHLDFLSKQIVTTKTSGKKVKKRTKTHLFFENIDYRIARVQKEAVWDTVIQEDSHWCFADQGSYKMTLRRIFKNYQQSLVKAKEAKRHILTNFTTEKILGEMADAIYSPEEFNVEKWLKEFKVEEHD